MGYAEKVYIALQDGDPKIEIHVLPVSTAGGDFYMALMVTLACGDVRLKSLPETKIEKTLELVIAACEKWIKTNLGQNVVIGEKEA